MNDSIGRDAGTKVCPRCAEDVREAALICRFCSYSFDARAGPAAGTREVKVIAVFVTLAFTIGVLVLINLGMNEAQNAQTRKLDRIAPSSLERLPPSAEALALIHEAQRDLKREEQIYDFNERVTAGVGAANGMFLLCALIGCLLGLWSRGQNARRARAGGMPVTESLFFPVVFATFACAAVAGVSSALIEADVVVHTGIALAVFGLVIGRVQRRRSATVPAPPRLEHLRRNMVIATIATAVVLSAGGFALATRSSPDAGSYCIDHPDRHEPACDGITWSSDDSP